MNAKIQKVICHIDENLDESFNVEELANIAGYSLYHFCRIFKVTMGESVMTYATRLRIERASQHVTHEDKSILDVALDAGFETPAGFNKAFKRRFGTTPTIYRNRKEKQLQYFKEIEMKTPEIVTRDKAYVVFKREMGEYNKSSEIAWKILSDKLNKLNELFIKKPPKEGLIFDKNEAEILGLCHDDPKLTNEENIRYDAAVAWGKEEIESLSSYGFDSKEVMGGKYAKVLYKGSYSQAEKYWYGLYAWLVENKYEFRDQPAFEKYLNLPTEVSEDELLTEIYIPIE